MIKVSEGKPDPSPPSCGHPSVELKNDADVKDQESSDMCPANQDSFLHDSTTTLPDREEAGIPKQGKTPEQKNHPR